ncbi:hypothetical protein IFM89_009402 [Coptis chinensis]|uniref:RNase H type-1 domain-containing protein n=1 Tax=Coptis chinensis TaxID=261450 RepID=A0A835GYT6_9MAGN|nr:hypothetical protein IFM89_009402 [Coptis chinensis]
MFKAFNLIDDMIKIKNDVLIKKPTPSSFETQIAWTPPCQHWVKRNTDGSALGAPGPAVADVMVAEFSAVRIRLKAALCLNFCKIIIETDSKYVHQVISERETRVSKAIKSLVHDIRDMLTMIDEYMILWNYREVNFVADAFAKWATNLAANQQWWANPIIHRDDVNANMFISLPSLCSAWWMRPPQFVVNSLNRDMQGVSTSRIVMK